MLSMLIYAISIYPFEIQGFNVVLEKPSFLVLYLNE